MRSNRGREAGAVQRQYPRFTACTCAERKPWYVAYADTRRCRPDQTEGRGSEYGGQRRAARFGIRRLGVGRRRGIETRKEWVSMVEGRRGRSGGAGSQMRSPHAPEAGSPSPTESLGVDATLPPGRARPVGNHPVPPQTLPQPNASTPAPPGHPWSAPANQGVSWPASAAPTTRSATVSPTAPSAGGPPALGQPRTPTTPPSRPFGSPPGAQPDSGTVFRPPQAAPLHVFRPSGGAMPPLVREAGSSLRPAKGAKELLVPFR